MERVEGENPQKHGEADAAPSQGRQSASRTRHVDAVDGAEGHDSGRTQAMPWVLRAKRWSRAPQPHRPSIAPRVGPTE